MKKIISILVIACILCGCSGNDENEAIRKLNGIFSNYAYVESAHRTNNNTTFYSFYLPSDIQELEFDETYHHLVFNTSDFVMNLNINYILCDKVFMSKPDDPFTFISNYAIYEKDNLGSEDTNKYKFCLYNIKNQYFFSFYSDKLYFFGSTNLVEVDELVNHLFEINNSVKPDYDKIIDSYYLGTTIDYTQPQLELFNKYIPVEGTLDTLLDQDGEGASTNHSGQESENTQAEDEAPESSN